MTPLLDADLGPPLAPGTRIAILGYGNQGRAQALNLRDSGADVIVGQREGAGAERARADGFSVMTPAEAVAGAAMTALLVPDEVQAALFADGVGDALPPGAALVFAHGFAIRFGQIAPRADIDVVLVAPKGPGTALRDRFVAGGGLVTLVGVAQDASGAARARALAFAGALGGGRAGIFETSFAEECEADLFNEGAVIWGAVPELILAGFETLVEAGVSEEVAYFECLTEVSLLADLLVRRGIAGMREAISNTAEYGAMAGGRRIVTEATRAEMRRMLAEVRSGAIARDLIADAAAGYPKLRASRAAAAAHPLERVAARLRGTG